MSSVIIRGSFAGRTFVPIDETPDVEGPAELIVHIHGSPPKTLYHYCGEDAFSGILKSKEVWLSSADFTNDYTEGKLIVEKAKQHLEAARNEPFPNKLRNALCANIITPFITCFSSESDLLSQWRGYANGGAGFAIGFSLQALVDECKKHPQVKNRISIDRVRYEEWEHDELLSNCLNNHFDTDKNAREKGSDGVMGQLGQARDDIQILGGYCKNQGFREEAEYRILLRPANRFDPTTGGAVFDVGTSPLQIRLTGRGVVPYFALRFSEGAISRIVLGPKNWARENEDDLCLFLKANGYDAEKIEISRSQVTFC